MPLTLTAKLKLIPTQEQAVLLNLTHNAYKNGCNYVSNIVFNTKNLNQFKLQEATYYNLRTDYGLRSQMAISIVRTVIASYKAAKSNGHDWTKVIFKKPRFDLVWNRDYSLKKDVFSINTLEGRIKVPFESKGMEHYFNNDWHFGTAKLVFKHNKWFLHIPMTKEVQEADINNINNIVGIDMGINFITTSYDSKGKTNFINGKTIKHKRAHYKNLRKQLQQRGTSSSRRRLKAIGQRENRWMTDVNHCVSKALVSKYGANSLFVIEDLTGIRTTTEKVKLKNRYTSVSWAFYQLRCFLEYKALKEGSLVVAVDPKYTSQTCPKCGHTEKANRNKKLHIFGCKTCGYRSNDDRIGAMNLWQKGIEYIVKEATTV